MFCFVEVNQLLEYAKKKFSDVLLPEEVVTKLELIGEGMYRTYVYTSNHTNYC